MIVTYLDDIIVVLSLPYSSIGSCQPQCLANNSFPALFYFIIIGFV